MIVTIDGVSGCWKSNIGKRLAKSLKFTHISSGELYRYISLVLSEGKYSKDEVMKNDNIITNIKFCFNSQNQLTIDGQPVIEKLRSEKVNEIMPWVNQINLVREKVNSTLRNLAKKNNLVVDGRDTGSHVFPKAEFKFFFYASSYQRAAKFHDDPENIEYWSKKLEARDKEEFSRKINPLIRPEGSFEVNPFEYGIDQTINLMSMIIRGKLGGISYEEINYSNHFTKDMNQSSIVYVCNLLKILNPIMLNNVDIIMTDSIIPKDSHLYQYVRDFGISIVQKVKLGPKDIDLLNKKKLTIRSENGNVNISPFHVNTMKFKHQAKNQNPDSILVSQKRGMKIYCQSRSQICAMRGEFVIFNCLYQPPCYLSDKCITKEIEKTLSFAAKLFDEIIYRFSDLPKIINNNNAKEKLFDLLFKKSLNNQFPGKRGLSTLLNENHFLFEAELEGLLNIENVYKNRIHTLLPYPTSNDEILNMIRVLRKRGVIGSIGVMVETPYMLHSVFDIQEEIDFFVIGTSDLLQLFSGMNRENSVYSSHIKKLLADQIDNVLIKNIDSEKSIFIPDIDVLNHIRNNNSAHSNLLFLRKY